MQLNRRVLIARRGRSPSLYRPRAPPPGSYNAISWIFVAPCRTTWVRFPGTCRRYFPSVLQSVTSIPRGPDRRLSSADLPCIATRADPHRADWSALPQSVARVRII